MHHPTSAHHGVPSKRFEERLVFLVVPLAAVVSKYSGGTSVTHVLLDANMDLQVPEIYMCNHQN